MSSGSSRNTRDRDRDWRDRDRDRDYGHGSSSSNASRDRDRYQGSRRRRDSQSVSPPPSSKRSRREDTRDRNRDRRRGDRDRDRDRERERDRDRNRERGRDRERERDRDRQRDKPQDRERQAAEADQRRLERQSRVAEFLKSKGLKGSSKEPEAKESSPSSTASTPKSSKPSGGIDMAATLARIQARKAQVLQQLAEDEKQSGAKERQRSVTPVTGVSSRQETPLSPPSDSPQERGIGLNTEIHPLLLETMRKTALNSIKIQRSGGTTEEIKDNPYLSHLLDDLDELDREDEMAAATKSKQKIPPTQEKSSYTDPSLATPVGPTRRPAIQLGHFVAPGTYIRQAEAMRNAFLEKLRAEREAEEAARRLKEQQENAERKLDASLSRPVDGIAREREMKPPTPPEMEWWDQQLYTSNDDQTHQTNSSEDAGKPSPPSTEQSFPETITHYIHHPVPIVQDGTQVPQPALRLHLTKRETKRLRKNARAERLKEQQDMIRLGLVPAPPPKVKLTNLMSVLTNEAIANPTLVEARVRAEVAARRRTHEANNAERKLTREQRAEKLVAKEERHRNEHGTYMAAFRTRCPLTDARQRFKVAKNAQQLHLGGIAVSVRARKPDPSATNALPPSPTGGFAVIIVQGSQTAVNKYTRLLLNRINWTEAAPPREENDEDDAEMENDGDEDENLPDPSTPGSEEQQLSKRARKKLKEQQKKELELVPVNLDLNACDEIWTGPVLPIGTSAPASYSKKSNVVTADSAKAMAASPRLLKWCGINDMETELDAKDLLAKHNCDNFWVLAHSLE